MSHPQIRIGLPIPNSHLADTVRALDAPALVSANSFARRNSEGYVTGFKDWPETFDGLDVALDSAGFVAMAHYNGFDWSVEQYVARLVAPGSWSWWAPMDCCCEPEVAGNPAVVKFRQAETHRLFYLCQRAARRFGAPDPIPVLQGWSPDDYERMAGFFDLRDVPLVGVGSVCRRPVHGPTGVLAVAERLHRVLPPGVRLHLFGVKGDALPELLLREGVRDRIGSIDSMAWDSAARWEVPTGRTVQVRARYLRRWYETQSTSVESVSDTVQADLGVVPHRPLPWGWGTDDPLLEQWLDLVALGEVEMKQARFHYERECWAEGRPPETSIGPVRSASKPASGARAGADVVQASLFA